MNSLNKIVENNRQAAIVHAQEKRIPLVPWGDINSATYAEDLNHLPEIDAMPEGWELVGQLAVTLEENGDLGARAHELAQAYVGVHGYCGFAILERAESEVLVGVFWRTEAGS